MEKGKNNRFQLDKGTSRKFDMSKGGKRTFDLSKDTDSAEAPGGTGTEVAERSSKRGWWIGIAVAAVAVIAAILWINFPSDKSSRQESAPDEIADNKTAPANEAAAHQPATPGAPAADAAGNSQESPSEEPQSQSAATQAATTPSDAPSSGVSDNVEAEALRVIRGDYGVGQERRDRLGVRYQAIQDRVNELKREGAF